MGMEKGCKNVPWYTSSMYVIFLKSFQNMCMHANLHLEPSSFNITGFVNNNVVKPASYTKFEVIHKDTQLIYFVMLVFLR